VVDSSAQAYSRAGPGISGARFQLHTDGRLGFNAAFSADPGAADPGLGPLFNGDSCEGCHLRRGRSRDGALLRLSDEGVDSLGGPRPAPGYGTQLQDKAVPGFLPEGRLSLRFAPSPGSYPDGTAYELRIPQVSLDRPHLAATPVHQGVRAPRALFGLGLLEAVPSGVLETLADPDDTNGDGISGRVNRVWDHQAGRTVSGRFGWKANVASLVEQVAAAYVEDMGVTSRIFPKEAVAGQDGQDDGLADDPELPDDRLASVTFFLQTVAVPARRLVNDPLVRRGQEVFADLGCGGCHVPTLQTGTLDGLPEVSGQTIHPYSDLLLHDMGDALADGRQDYEATGREWRTPPLWGLGLAHTVQGHTELLHDGRARNVEEAILWHGGEAATARARFMALAADARIALLAFLASI
jgi:CxxC motif-containing protein (DUF1111 family)